MMQEFVQEVTDTVKESDAIMLIVFEQGGDVRMRQIGGVVGLDQSACAN